MSYKNIWSVLIFTFTSQIGSGIFLLPTFLYEFGEMSLLIIIFTGIISTLISLVFAETGLTCCEIIKKSFGEKISSYIGKVYWFISWFSTIIVVKELSGYLFQESYILFEVLVVLFFILINLKNTNNLMLIESIFTILKILPLFVLIFCYYKTTNTYLIKQTSPINFSIFLKSMWLFVGLENGSLISNLFKTNIKERKIGVYLGMLLVILMYLISVFCVFKLGGKEILNNTRPYQVIFQKYLSSNSNILSFCIISVLLGCINSWILSTGYLGYELAKIKILPKNFLIVNKNNIPYVSIIVSGLLIIPFLFIKSNSLYTMLVKLVDFSSLLAFLIYGMCTAAYAKNFVNKTSQKLLYGIISIFIMFFFFLEIYKFIFIH
ncbi:hypothetical protein AB836_00845 [Rickettsiales bacterium (ex Bugula neritina AB1)]|nr:hypothetical protein AB836_00845 [Rickettsiales bacterium (ex Bugula neritina AB1)]